MVAATLRNVAGFSPAGQKTQPDSSNFYKYILLVLAVCVCLPARLAADSPSATFSIVPVNPAFVAWQAKTGPLLAESRDEQGHALGFISSPLDRSHLISKASVLTTQLTEIPSSYDLRTLGYVTPVKNQGGCGSCWAFGSYGPLESWLLKNVAETWDLSENNLKNCNGFDVGTCETGGNEDMSTAYMVRWSGPVSEADDPYHAYDESCSSGKVCQKYVENVLWFFTSSNIKNALMTYGGMCVSMYWGSAYYHPSEYTYYYSGSSSANHAITLIGWDDNKVVTGAPHNGAWLVKNSWGATWGNNGYFWISYYDKVAVKYSVTFCNAVPTSSYATNYQYDPLGWTTSAGYGSPTAWAANIFTATANEQLKAVGTYAGADGTSYIISIYDTFDGSTFSNLLGSVSGTLSNSGYHTIPLASPINLTTGNDFSIVVKFTTPGYKYPIPLEMDFSGYSSGATASPGQSYISSTGTTFTDITTYYSHTNVCIRGLTITPGIAPQIISTPVTTAAVGQPYVYDVDANGIPEPNYALLESPAGMDINSVSGLIQWTPDVNQVGDVNVTVEALNAAGSDTQSFTITVSGIAPQIISTPVTTAAVGQPYVYDVNATGTPEPNYALLESPAGMDINTVSGLIQWTPSAEQIGDVNVTVEALNAAGSDTQSFTITVWGIAIAPQIISTPVTTAAVGQPYVYDVNATGTPEPNYALLESPAGMDINTVSGLIQWTPDINQIGDINVTVQALNAAGSDTQSFTITVSNVFFSISGYVLKLDGNTPLEGVLMQTDDNDINTLTDANGYYVLWVDYGWSGIVTPQKDGYAFEPNSRYYADVNEDYTGQDYTGTLLTYRITGYIKNECNVPIEGVLVDANNSGGDGTTDVNGLYEVWVDYNWSGTVTPTKQNYTFEPNLMSYVGVIADQFDQNSIASNVYDLDCNGEIGWGDVGVLADNWLSPSPERGDFNEDGTVNFLDFAELVTARQDE